MPNSLRAKLSKLRHDGNINDAEYQELIKKLDGHDAKVRADTIEEFVGLLNERLFDDGLWQCVTAGDIDEIEVQLRGQRK